MGDKSQMDIGHLSARAMQHCQQGQMVEAVKYYDKAYQLSRELNNDVYERTCALNLGAIYIANGDIDKGLVFLHKATPPGGQRDLHSNGDLYFNFGLAYEKSNDLKKALKMFDDAFEEHKYCHNPESQMDCLNKRLDIFRKRKDYLSCADECQKMADVFRRSEQIKRAEKLAEKAGFLRLANKFEDAEQVIMESWNEINDAEPSEEECIAAGNVEQF